MVPRPKLLGDDVEPACIYTAFTLQGSTIRCRYFSYFCTLSLSRNCLHTLFVVCLDCCRPSGPANKCNEPSDWYLSVRRTLCECTSCFSFDFENGTDSAFVFDRVRAAMANLAYVASATLSARKCRRVATVPRTAMRSQSADSVQRPGMRSVP